MLRKIRLVGLLTFIIPVLAIQAQEEFTTEIGFHGGGSLFQGDLGISTPAIPKVNYGLTFRYLFNKRISLLADFSMTEVKGKFEHQLPSLYPGTVTLNNKLNILDLVMAFNFLDYGKVDNILKSSNYSTYLFAGLGFVDPTGVMGLNEVHMSLPLGIGLKLKMSKRTHMTVQLTHRFMLYNDGLERDITMNDPAGINGTNIDNNDQISTLSLGITYNLFRRPCKCLNYY
jgi:hypothetical protein